MSHREFQRTGITCQRSVLDSQRLGELLQETRHLEGHAESLNVGHSNYLHVKPFVFAKTKPPWPDQRWRLPDLYHSAEFTDRISKIVGAKLQHMPLAEDPRFEINCKLNYYRFYPDSPSRTKLGWHYDRTDQVQGRVFVVVLTLENELDAYVSGLPAANRDTAVPILSFFPVNAPVTKRSLYLSANSITVHDPKLVFHRANPINIKAILSPAQIRQHKEQTGRDYFRRTIFVMKYTTDGTPKSPLEASVDKAAFVARSLTGYTKLKAVAAVAGLASMFLIVLLIVLLSQRRRQTPK
jgi:hypothetical protein